MSIHLTDEQLVTLLAAYPKDEKLLKEMKFRTRLKIVHELPSPTGTCSAGIPVILDDKGAYSSGYWVHVYPEGMPNAGRARGGCNHVDPKTGAYTGEYEVKLDPRTPKAVRLHRLLDSLR